MKSPALRHIATASILPLLIAGCNSPTPQSTPTTAGQPTPNRVSGYIYPVEELRRRTVARRALEAVIWGMPAVNFDRMYQAMVHDAKAGEGSNKIVFWSKLFDWKNQTLTPNPDSVYFMPFYDTRDVGPIVIEVPPADDEGSITGSIDDCWQTALEDVGPAGVDKGKGGKYLILPPDFKGKPPAGYIALPSLNYQGFALLRSIPKSGSDADVATAVSYGKRIKLYPLSRATRSPQTEFIDAINVVYDSTIPWDMRFFQSLYRMVQTEPWLTRDKAMIDSLRSLGIVHGEPFSPDTQTQDTLKDAISEAHQWVIDTYENHFFPQPYNAGTHWSVPATPELVEGMSNFFSDPNSYPIDKRAITYSMGFFSAKHLGAGQFYLLAFRDKNNTPFNSANTYRLHVPANAPVTQYWSATVYDRDTHALIRGMQWASRSSQTPGLQKNSDGSVDIYFAPQAPHGKDSNWIPTNSSGKFEVLFRLYGPQQPFFEKTWILPDVEVVR